MDQAWIRPHRQQKHLSQAALGKLVGLTPSEISRLECGYRILNDSEAKAIAAALGYNPTSPASPPTPAAVGLGQPPAVTVAVPVTKPAPAPVAPATVVTPTVVANPFGKPDLSFPGKFAEIPNPDWLQTTGADFQKRLTAAIAYATQILHTSKVPAAVWREWRSFERKAAETMRGQRG